MISVIQFKGTKPKVSAHLLDNEDAQSAIDCKLEQGIVQGLNKTETISQLSTTDTLGMFQYLEGSNTHWVTSVNRLDAVRSPLSNDTYERLFFTGETQPRYFANDFISSPFDASTDYIKMGIPTPASAPDYDSGHTGDSNYVAHFYTYVNRYGVEGPPSPVVSASTWDGSTSIVLSGFTEATEGHACNSENDGLSPKIRLYRTASSAAGVGAFQFVKDTTVNDATNYATLTITDDVAAADLGEVCPSIYWYAPDSNMIGLIGLSNGIFAGFYGNTLYFSDPYLPEAWPTSYEITFSETIIGIGQYGTAIVVCTDESPYLVYGSHPSTMSKKKLPGFYPCSSRSGIVSTEHGVFYPSKEGLMLVNQNGVINVTKDNLISLSSYYPTTWVSEYYKGKYYGFFTGALNSGAIVFDIYNNLINTLTGYMSSAYVSSDDSKMYVVGTKDSSTTEYIQEWEGDEYNLRQFTWKSKKFMFSKELNLSSARVILDLEFYSTISGLLEENNYLSTLNTTLFASDLLGSINASAINVYPINGSTLYTLDGVSLSSDVTFKLYVDNELKFTKIITSEGPFRLPSGYKGRRVEFQISGYIPIREVSLAGSIRGLRKNV